MLDHVVLGLRATLVLAGLAALPFDRGMAGERRSFDGAAGLVILPIESAPATKPARPKARSRAADLAPARSACVFATDISFR